MAFKITRKARAAWQGTVEEGGGQVRLGSGVFEGPYSLRGRVGDVRHANPEELIGAGHAACFTMALANLLGEADAPPQDLRTEASVRLEESDGRFTIASIALRTVGRVDGVDDETFLRLAEEAKATCPVSRALAGTEITLTAQLVASEEEAVT
jgi:lipoyl-dependent peroxiredoxin